MYTIDFTERIWILKTPIILTTEANSPWQRSKGSTRRFVTSISGYFIGPALNLLLQARLTTTVSWSYFIQAYTISSSPQDGVERLLIRAVLWAKIRSCWMRYGRIQFARGWELENKSRCGKCSRTPGCLGGFWILLEKIRIEIQFFRIVIVWVSTVSALL